MNARLISKMIVVFAVFFVLVFAGVQAAKYADDLAKQSEVKAATIESILSE